MLGPDDRDPNGLFTRVLLRKLDRPGVSIDRLMREVRTEVVTRARAIADTIARQAPLAVQAALLNARVAVEQGHEAALAALMPAARALMGTDDAREGVQSFIERRDARFTGK